MSTFYLLPSRPQLGERFAAFLGVLFPGLDMGRGYWAELADALAAVAGGRPDAYVVFRDDLPEGEDPAAALVEGFGAAAGDEVIEVLARTNAAEWTARRWRVGAAQGRLEAVS